MKCAEVSAALLLFAAAAYSELPPKAYEMMRANAPELVRFTVNSVETTSRTSPCSHGGTEVVWHVVARGTVGRVIRTESHLRGGESIRVVYNTIPERCRGWVGPSQIRMLNKGERFWAYLAKEGESFTPAAGSQSFTSTLPGK